MSEYPQSFIAHLERLRERDPGALAKLRRSLGFAPGAYAPVYPYVERFVAVERHAQDASRLALYLVAGLYATHPRQATNSLAASLGELMRLRDSASIEQRFVALLGADAENLANYLRQIISLLAAGDRPLDYGVLLRDLGVWLNPHVDPERRDAVRQRWARDFYRALAAPANETMPTPANA
ncbi:type I-E CRISPR-associated protein Cse2/CasB [Pseudomonas benzenivorans]|uniref:Type I-E CRISPR-associated protein Cse2/CasB n=1 Tax=Pseudomonas benzenivorans TaxID=556533 RepID=A0ABZ0PUU5_9PSED|nr:type I-E CRISPR-associated protein Cse2/CasB [Pseudomonas benzenivorans]WPC04511.1 type I-E CRISPR-associated protein Cse2/CasB [Pseudomonas benzenivorans]